ncbi:MAG: substrate-binding domain-containing protein [Rhodospirillales bacterium]
MSGMIKWPVLALLLAMTGFGTSYAQGRASFDNSFWPLEDFLAEHPDEARKTREFVKLVNGPALQAPDDRAVSITVIYPGRQVSDYWRRSVTSMIRRLKEGNQPYRLRNRFTLPGVELHRQAEFLIDAIDENPDYLIFTLDVTEHMFFIEQVLARGQSRLILQNVTTPVRGWKSRQPFLYDGFDHAAGTRLLADYFLRRYAGTARYAILFGTDGYVSQARGESFRNAMDQHPGMTLVDAYYTGFNRARSNEAATAILRDHPDIDFIYTVSTDIAIGAIEAIRAQGRQGSVAVNGWGGGTHELKVLASGELDVTVMQITDDNGVAMADAILLDRLGRTEEVPRVFSGAMELIDRDTPKERIEELEKRAFRYSR